MTFPFDRAIDASDLLTALAKALGAEGLSARGLEVGRRLRAVLSTRVWEAEWLWYLGVRKELHWYERVVFDKYFAYLYVHER